MRASSETTLERYSCETLQLHIISHLSTNEILNKISSLLHETAYLIYLLMILYALASFFYRFVFI